MEDESIYEACLGDDYVAQFQQDSATSSDHYTQDGGDD